MSIAAPQETGFTQDNATAVSKVFAGNVTSGNLITVGCSRFNGGANTAFVAGDCTKSAGTATVGTITLDKQANVNTTNPNQAGVWSVPVTGTGTCTMRVAGAAASYYALGIGEYSGTDVGASRVESSNSNTATTNTTPATTGNGTSAGEALFFAALSVDDGSGNSLNTAGNSFTNIHSETNGTAHQCGAIARRIVVTGTTTQGSWTEETTLLNGWACVVVVYKVAAAASFIARPNTPISQAVNRASTY